MVLFANGKQQNSEEYYLLVYLKLTTKSMLKFMLRMRKTKKERSKHCMQVRQQGTLRGSLKT